MSRDEIPLFAPEKPPETDRLVREPLRDRPRREALRAPARSAPLHLSPARPPVSPKVLEERYRKLSTRRSPDGREAWLNWALRVRGGGYAGLLEATVEADRIAYVAYTVFVPYQGMDFGAEGCRRLLRHLFEDYNVTAAVAEVDTRNAASIALVEAPGFERVSFHKNADHFEGAPSDEYRYELRRPRSSRC